MPRVVHSLQTVGWVGEHVTLASYQWKCTKQSPSYRTVAVVHTVEMYRHHPRSIPMGMYRLDETVSSSHRRIVPMEMYRTVTVVHTVEMYRHHPRTEQSPSYRLWKRTDVTLVPNSHRRTLCGNVQTSPSQRTNGNVQT